MLKTTTVGPVPRAVNQDQLPVKKKGRSISFLIGSIATKLKEQSFTQLCLNILLAFQELIKTGISQIAKLSQRIIKIMLSTESHHVNIDFAKLDEKIANEIARKKARKKAREITIRIVLNSLINQQSSAKPSTISHSTLNRINHQKADSTRQKLSEDVKKMLLQRREKISPSSQSCTVHEPSPSEEKEEVFLPSRELIIKTEEVVKTLRKGIPRLKKVLESDRKTLPNSTPTYLRIVPFMGGVSPVASTPSTRGNWSTPRSTSEPSVINSPSNVINSPSDIHRSKQKRIKSVQKD